MNWTQPYYGVSHLGKFSLREKWATVNDHGRFAELLRWFPGCQFHPHKSTHATAAEARKAGEKWMTQGD